MKDLEGFWNIEDWVQAYLLTRPFPGDNMFNALPKDTF